MIEKKYGILLASIMFIWSGMNSLMNFDKKLISVHKKTGWPIWMSKFGLGSVILLELIGMIALLDYYFGWGVLVKGDEQQKKEIARHAVLHILIFLVVVTLLYHPLNMNNPVPFLSNLSLFGLFYYVYADLS